MKEEDGEFIGAQEAADILHMSKTHFLNLLKKKALPFKFLKIGTRAKFKRKDIVSYFESRFSDEYDKTPIEEK
jgi:excisionase family DNA binding protein